MSDHTTAADRASGEFERYGLLAALTLVVLCLLLADRVRTVPSPGATVPRDRLLRIRIGGRAATAAGSAPRADAAAAQGPAAPAHAAAHAGTQPAPKPAVAIERACVVGEGETLGDIALRELGTSKRAREIADLNGIANVHQVRTGQTLRLPSK